MNVEKEDMEMKVVNVDFVENEMVEMNVVQIGSNWGWIEVECEDESDCGSVECGNEYGDGHAKGTSPSPHPLPNQSKPIVLTPSHSLSFPFIPFSYIFITFSYIFITISYNL